jgi:hypothetical protein
MDLDPKATNANQKVGGMELLNVDGFLIENVFSVQNGTLPDPAAVKANNGAYPWPTSAKAVIVMRPRNDSPLLGPFLDPHNGAIQHHYNIGGPFGYGPNQITSGHSIRVSQVYSRGGTALRLETDSTKRKSFGGEIRGLTADTIMGVNCNRAVSFSPHAQKNFEVHVSHVVARSCHQGVVESADENLSAAERGGFWDSTISDVSVIAGNQAQDPLQNGGSAGTWKIGPSVQSFARDTKANWFVTYSNLSCKGSFSEGSNSITVGASKQTPACQ